MKLGIFQEVDAMKSYDAGCSCGSTRYRFTGIPRTVYACHCTECQKRTGSAFGLSMHISASSFEILEGTPEEVAKPDGSVLQFCKKCSNCIVYKFSSEIYCIFPGHFDDTSWFNPVGNIWVRSAQPWVHIDKRIKSYEKNPDYKELYQLYEQTS